MPVTTTYMSLVTWPAPSDFFDHTALAANFTAIDAHDHTATKGTQVPTSGILDGAVTPPKVSGLHVADVYTNRPTATSALNGVRFFATDKLMEWQCVSAVWTLMNVFAPEVTTLPASPVDQQECIYVADATNGIKWHARYRSASASTSKWEVIGGSPLTAYVSTAEARTGATYADLATVGPSITLPAVAGTWEVAHGVRVNVPINEAAYSAPKYGAAAVQDTDAVYFITGPADDTGSFTGSRWLTPLAIAASTVVKLQYRTIGAGSPGWSFRWLRIMPTRLG